MRRCFLPVLLVATLLAGCSTVLTTRPSSGATSVAADPADLLTARRAAGIADCPRPTGATAVEGGLPEVELDCLGGDSRVNLAELRGPLVINLWAQWCEPCRIEAPHLAALQTLRPEVTMLGIDYQDPSPDLAVEFAGDAGWRYPQVVDPDQLLAPELGVPGIPMTLFVDAEGRITARHPGLFTDLDSLLSWVDQEVAR